jgi:hypothetical protein
LEIFKFSHVNWNHLSTSFDPFFFFDWTKHLNPAAIELFWKIFILQNPTKQPTSIHQPKDEQRREEYPFYREREMKGIGREKEIERERKGEKGGGRKRNGKEGRRGNKERFFILMWQKYLVAIKFPKLYVSVDYWLLQILRRSPHFRSPHAWLNEVINRKVYLVFIYFILFYFILFHFILFHFIY